MTTTQVSGGGFTFQKDSTGGSWFWDVYVNNIPNLGQIAQIKNIISPYGIITSSFSIPSDVIVAMSESLIQFQQQLNPTINLITSSSYSATITEGDPSFELSEAIFQNTGAFGSFMSINASPGSIWLSSIPSQVNGIGKNSQCYMTPRINPISLLASNSPYSGVINYQDNANPNNIIPISFNIIVLPRPTFSLDKTSVSLTYSLSTLVGTSDSVVITNSGLATSLLSFTSAKVLNQSPWLQVTPTSGSGIPSGSSISMLFSLDNTKLPSISGIYTDTIRLVSKNATNTPQEIVVTLTITS